MNIVRLRVLCSIFCTGAAFSGAAGAADTPATPYPSKSVRIVVPFAAGGTSRAF